MFKTHQRAVPLLFGYSENERSEDYFLEDLNEFLTEMFITASDEGLLDRHTYIQEMLLAEFKEGIEVAKKARIEVLQTDISRVESLLSDRSRYLEKTTSLAHKRYLEETRKQVERLQKEVKYLEANELNYFWR